MVVGKIKPVSKQSWSRIYEHQSVPLRQCIFYLMEAAGLLSHLLLAIGQQHCVCHVLGP